MEIAFDLGQIQKLRVNEIFLSSGFRLELLRRAQLTYVGMRRLNVPLYDNCSVQLHSEVSSIGRIDEKIQLKSRVQIVFCVNGHSWERLRLAQENK